MHQTTTDRTGGSTTSLICGVIGLIGCVVVVAADLIGILMVERHDPISETISKLAIGKHAWIQDVGIDFLAAGFLANAVGLFAWRFGKARVKTVAVLLGLTAVDLVLIAEHNQYAGRDNEGAQIHTYCVYALFGLFVVASLLLAFDLRQFGSTWWALSLAASLAWIIGGPIFMYIVPTSWDGALERLLGLVMTGWLAMLSILMVQRGRRRLHRERVT
jgi:hypothetical protein